MRKSKSWEQEHLGLEDGRLRPFCYSTNSSSSILRIEKGLRKIGHGGLRKGCQKLWVK